MINTAAELSKQWHEGQVDKAGQPYWMHPARVAKNVQTLPGFQDLDAQAQQDIVCAAYLHDVIEDCDVTPDQLKEQGFPDNTINAVLLLSKNHDYTTIEEYCERVNANPLARAVKLADLSDNCNKQREQALRDKGVTIDETKYPKVLALLEPTTAEQTWFEQTIQLDIV